MQLDVHVGVATEDPQIDESQQKHLLFSLKGELYGTPLVSIREVLKLGPVKPVPYMSSHFSGIINLRGQIVSIIDLRVKFGLTNEAPPAGLVMVVETKSGVIGAVIDDLLCVKTIHPKDTELHPNLDTRIPIKFYVGVAKTSFGLVSLIDVASMLEER